MSDRIPPPPPGFRPVGGGAIPPPPPGFRPLPPETHNTAPALAGRQSELRQGKPQGMVSSAWDSVRQSIFGSPDREEAKAAGIGLQPTTADMARLALTGASFMGGGQLGAMAGRTLPGMLGRAGAWVARNPAVGDAALMAAPQVLEGDIEGAVENAAMGAILGRMGRGRARRPAAAPTTPPAPPTSAEEALAQAKALAASGRNQEAQAVVQAWRSRPAAPAPAAPVPTRPASAPAVAPQPAAAVPATAPPVDRGRAAAAAHGQLVAFARDAAKANPKQGQKIWMLLDDSGVPVKVLTPDQAGAAARKGQKTTWVKNLWGRTLPATD